MQSFNANNYKFSIHHAPKTEAVGHLVAEALARHAENLDYILDII